ncbi:hypothetical protein [Variovorax sp. OV329]|uniref:hypothetical protein n=1 Tax=Variovorax sp. OV329 TaxID=1882825 RepID=UPI0008E13F2E|nr:hypothetical protein [Variovorax sp. OV329]SFM28745.1 hypothetical protein SAMN05444747_10492 [Variovorax sp. OV329]
MTKTTKILLRTGVALAAALMLASTAAAQAPNTDKPNTTRPAQTIKPAPQNRVGNSIQNGTDAAGRGISRADSATRSGINKGADAASRPVRNLGDSIGRKLGLGPATTNPPAGGHQGTPP